MDKLLPLLANPQVLSVLFTLLSGLGGTSAQAEQPEVLWTAKQLQEWLNKVGESVPVTGKNDEATHLAVKNFQRKHNLVVDGWAGIKTYAVLFTELAKQ